MSYYHWPNAQKIRNYSWIT